MDDIAEYLKIKEANSKGYAEAYEGYGVNIGASGSHTRRGRVNKGGVNTLTTQAEQGVVVYDEQNHKATENADTINTIMADESSPKKNARISQGLRIRKLTPKECWRLQGFGYMREDGTWDDSLIEKAKYKKETLYIVGGKEECNAKLMVVKEQPKLTDTEICVLCTIKDMLDMETLQMTVPTFIQTLEQENLLNVNIVVIKSAGMERLECATNIIKCIEFMGMPCTVIINREVHQVTDIIVQAKVGKGNIERYMRITTESNWTLTKLFTTLILLKQIIELKIFSSATLEANMQCYTQNITDLGKSTKLRISNLKMEHIEQRVSDSELYKQAGNAVSCNITQTIALAILQAEEKEEKNGKEDTVTSV